MRKFLFYAKRFIHCILSAAEENNIETELHYIHVSDENWKKQIEERNKRVESGNGGADFYLDEGLMKKLVSKFEEPTEDEVDVWYENDYMSRKQK